MILTKKTKCIKDTSRFNGFILFQEKVRNAASMLTLRTYRHLTNGVQMAIQLHSSHVQAVFSVCFL